MSEAVIAMKGCQAERQDDAYAAGAAAGRAWAFRIATEAGNGPSAAFLRGYASAVAAFLPR
jgi:hypothetical protein